jgi:hypothetical protein
MIKVTEIPSIIFKAHRRENSDWLLERRDRFEKRWNKNCDGEKLIKRIMRICNLPFPKDITSLTVNMKKYVHKNCKGTYGCIDDVDVPNRITLYVRKKDRYVDLKKTLCHEIIHSLFWSNTKHDERRIGTSFFADIFADELLTTMLEAYIIKGKLTYRDYEWALNYAREDTCAKLENLKRKSDYHHILNELKGYFIIFNKNIKNGSNALVERQRALKDISAP